MKVAPQGTPTTQPPMPAKYQSAPSVPLAMSSTPQPNSAMWLFTTAQLDIISAVWIISACCPTSPVLTSATSSPTTWPIIQLTTAINSRWIRGSKTAHRQLLSTTLYQKLAWLVLQPTPISTWTSPTAKTAAAKYTTRPPSHARSTRPIRWQSSPPSEGSSAMSSDCLSHRDCLSLFHLPILYHWYFIICMSFNTGLFTITNFPVFRGSWSTCMNLFWEPRRKENMPLRIDCPRRQNPRNFWISSISSGCKILMPLPEQNLSPSFLTNLDEVSLSNSWEFAGQLWSYWCSILRYNIYLSFALLNYSIHHHQLQAIPMN